MGHADEGVETHAFPPHILPPGVHATPSVPPTALEQAVATLVLVLRTWGLQEAAPVRKQRERMPTQTTVMPKPSSLHCICKEAREGQPGRWAPHVQRP